MCSIFEGGAIPYPKRDFLAEDEPDDKADAGAKRPNCDTVRIFRCLPCDDKNSDKTYSCGVICVLQWGVGPDLIMSEKKMC